MGGRRLVGVLWSTCVVASASAGCDRVFGLAGPDRDGATDAADGVYVVAVPRLFPDAAPAGASAYLFEGTGHATAGPHRPVPLAIRRVAAGDQVSLIVPPQLGADWEVCGQPVGAGELALDLAQLPAPCRHAGDVVGLAIVVPVSPATSAGATVDPLVVRVRRGEMTTEHPIAIVPLDELLAADSSTLAGLYSRIQVGDFVPGKNGPAIRWRSVSDVQLDGTLDVRGNPGQTHNATNNCGLSGMGCAGGLAGPGNTGDGARSCGTFTIPTCPAAAPLGGGGGEVCGNGNNCNNPIAASGGGGGGYADRGNPGLDSTSGACANDPGGAGGVADADPFLLAPSGGGGGGAGAGMLVSSLDPPMHSGGGGGGGGGVVTIETHGELRIGTGGMILASGGAGGNGFSRSCLGRSMGSGRGGGGAGGAIRLRARSIAASVDLNAKLVAAGGNANQGLPSEVHGDGAPGRIRVDATGGFPFDVTRAGVVRGHDLDDPLPVVDTETVTVTARAHTTGDGMMTWGYRPTSATAYTLDVKPAAAGAISLVAPLAPGLNEVCVFPVPPQSAEIAAIADETKRCTWVVRAGE